MIVIVEVDTNDADYVTCETTINAKQLVDLKIVISKLVRDSSRSIRFPANDHSRISMEEAQPNLTEDDVEYLSQFCAGHEHGFHTINSIRIIEVCKVLI